GNGGWSCLSSAAFRRLFSSTSRSEVFLLMARPRKSPARPAPEPVIQSVVREPMPRDRMEWVEAWGMSTGGTAWVFRPTTADGIREAFACAREHGRTVALRGAGRSYGDASLNNEQVILDLTRMRRILRW